MRWRGFVADGKRRNMVTVLRMMVVVCGVLWACGRTEQQSVGGAVRHSLGVELVEHDNLLGYEKRIYRPEFLFLVGGTAEGPPHLLFGQVGGVDVLGDGTVGVLDLQASEIRLFAADESFVGTVSRRGAGPGEISGDGALALLGVGADFFVVPDVVNQAINLLRVDGEVVATHPWDLAASFMPEWQAIDTTLAVRVSSQEMEIIVERTAAGEMVDTLALIPSEPREEPDDPRWPVWQDHLVWSVGDGGDVVVGRMSEATFTLYRHGSPVRRVSWTEPQEQLGTDEVDWLLRVVTNNIGGGEVPPGARSEFRFPDQVPAIANIETAEDGLILVQRLRPVGLMDRRVAYLYRAMGFGGREWHLFSSDGGYLGVLDIGAPHEIYNIRGDTIVGVKENELGVQEVFLARLPADLRAVVRARMEP